MTAMTEAVRRLRGLGFGLCRILANEKIPTYPGWTKSSVEAGDFDAHPSANLGILGGTLSGGLVIVDPDRPEVRAAALERLPRTMTDHRTSSSPGHLYYRVTDVPTWATAGVNVAGGIGGPRIMHFADAAKRPIGLDFIGTGGQVVCPPSMHDSGEQRTWLVEPERILTLPYLELWSLVKQLAIHFDARNVDRENDARPMEPAAQREPWSATSEVSERAIKYLAKCDPAISGQGGHAATFTAARVVVWGFDLGADAGFELLQQHYNRRCQPPWSDAELMHKCEDADAVPSKHKRGWLRNQARKPATAGVGSSGQSTGDRQEEEYSDGYGDSYEGPDPEPPSSNGTNHHERNGKPQESPPQWEPPAPIGTLPEPMPFPLDALPPQLADYIEQCAWATNSPVDFAAVPVLAIAAGCIGCSRRLEIQTEHTQPATLFAAVVGLPGTGKSPALEKVAAHLENHDARNLATWKLQSRAWKEENAETRGPEPRVKRLIVDDITTESLCKSIYENQHGLTMVADELSALVAGMNQYKGGQGNDRQIYQKIWAQTAIRVDRKGKPGSPPPPLVIRRPALSIIGGINPAVVESFLTNQQGKRVDDGFIDRFLVSYPKDNPAIEEQRRGIEEATQSAWHRTIDTLLTLNPIGDRDSYLPVNIPLTPDGWEAWVDFTRTHAAEVNATDFPAHHRGPWAKLRGYCGRLALVMAMVRMATEGMGGGFGPEQVDHLDVSRAVALIGYFKNHHVRVAGLLRTDPRIEETLKVLGWLKRGVDITFFSRRDCYKDLARSFRAPDALDSPLALLVQHGYICSLDKEEREGPGRKPSQRFAVNPLWDRQK